MDPVTVGLAISALKGTISAAKNLQSIGHGLEKLFNAQEEHKKNKDKPPKLTRTQQILRMRSGEGAEADSDPTSISSVAASVLAEETQKTELAALAAEIDVKFGAGVWAQILAQRAKLLKERAASEQLIKETALRKKKDDTAFWHKFWIETGKAALIICFAGLVILFLWWASSANISQLR
jgi:hypothetical protein